MTGRVLEVACFGRLAGTLSDGPRGLVFEYAPEWVDEGSPPLSQSLPLSGDFGPEQATAFFGGLLPEGVPRKVLARQLGFSPENEFAVLEALGGDTAGAVSLLLPGSPIPAANDDRVEWLDDTALAELIDELPTRPMHADSDGEWRLSLAGAQDKLPVIVGHDGRVGLTQGRTPSTHILKTPIERLPSPVANEAFCLDLGRRLGIDTANATPRRVEGREYLLVERYDRTHVSEGVQRLHQEDFCQALGIPSQRKYQNEGGPSLPDCFGLIRSAIAVPARDAPRLLDYVGLSLLVGNHDAHGKNYSLLYAPDSALASLAPAYDILSTVAYQEIQPMTRKMAMSIGGEYRPQYVQARHLDRLLDEAGLGVAPSRRRLRTLADQGLHHAGEARRELAGQGFDAPVLQTIEETIATRAEWLQKVAAASKPPVRRAPSRT